MSTELWTAGEAVHYLAQQKPDEVVVICARDSGGADELTRAELDSWTNRLAHRMIEQGVGTGEFVAIILPNCIEHVVATMAAYKAGARIWPSYVPTSPDDPEAPANQEAWQVLRQWEKPFLCCFSDGDPVTKGGERTFLEQVPGTAGQPHTTVEGGGHFFQEDCGPELARILIDFIG